MRVQGRRGLLISTLRIWNMFNRNVRIPFAIESNQLRSRQMSVQRLVNMYAATDNKQNSKTSVVLYNTPGLREYIDFGIDQPIYGMEIMNDNLYVVVGNDVYVVTPNLTKTKIGTFSELPSRVVMSNDGLLVTIVNDFGAGYVANDTTLTKITDIDFDVSNYCTFLSGRTIHSRRADSLNGGEFFWSELYESDAFSGDFASAEWQPDRLVAVFAFNTQMWAFGTDSTEVYSVSPNADLPFSRIEGATMNIGCLSKHSIASMYASIGGAQSANCLFWVGSDKSVYMGVGYQANKISTKAVEKSIAEYFHLEESIGFTYSQEGHYFYVLSSPKDSKITWVYDVSEGLWHERSSIDHKGFDNVWIVANSIVWNNLVLGGDINVGKVHVIDLDVFTDNGVKMISEVISKTQFLDSANALLARLELEMESGVGLISGQGEDPQVMLQVSRDGGNIWGYEMWRSIGRIGEYKKRTVWRTLGTSRNFTFRVRISDPVRRYLLGAYVDFEVLSN